MPDWLFACFAYFGMLCFAGLSGVTLVVAFFALRGEAP